MHNSTIQTIMSNFGRLYVDQELNRVVTLLRCLYVILNIAAIDEITKYCPINDNTHLLLILTF